MTLSGRRPPIRVLLAAAATSLSIFLFAQGAGASNPEEAPSLKARAAVLLDVTHDRVLYEKNGDQPLPTASLSKVMTTFMAFEAIEEGRLSLEDEFTSSVKAWRTGGSRTFIEPEVNVSVSDLLRGIIIQSGNDAAVVLAEGLSGSEEAFARDMTRRARELGMSSSTFLNATGLPAEGHEASAHDLAVLASTMWQRFPDLMSLYSEEEFTYNDISQRSRNPLLGKMDGVDGMKTGYTRKAGYGLISSVKRGNRRLVAVVMGLENPRARAEDARSLLEYGLRAFEHVVVADREVFSHALPVWQGLSDSVEVRPQQSLSVLLPGSPDLDVEVVANMPAQIPAPIAAGSDVGIITLRHDGELIAQVPLIAEDAVGRLPWYRRIAGNVL